MRSSRRQLLGLVGSAAVGGLAGCGETGDDATPTGASTGTAAGTEPSSDDVTIERSDVPEWTAWLPRPEALGLDGPYEVNARQPSEIDTYSDSLPASVTEWHDEETGIDGMGTKGDQHQTLRIAGAISVLEGPHDTERIRGSANDDEATKHRSVGGLDIYAGYTNDPRNAAGVGDGVFVSASLGDGRFDVDAVEAVAAVARDGDRLPAAVPTAKTALEVVAPGESVTVRWNGEEGAPEEEETVDSALAEGYSWRLGEDRTTITAAFVGDGGPVETGTVQSWADDSDIFQSASPAVTTDGAAVAAVGTAATGELSELTPPWERGHDLTFDSSYLDESGVLLLWPNGSGSIPANQLYVRGSGFADGESVTQTGPGQWQGETDGDGNVTPGDMLELGVTPAYSVRLVRQHPDGEETVLFEDSGPEA